MASSTSTTKMVTLRSSDNETFEVEENVISASQTVKHILDDCAEEEAIPLANVTGKILAKVVEYCKYHVKKTDNDLSEDDEKKKWDAQFVKVEQDELFDLILAANYLNIKGLLELTCKTVADMMKGKSPEEIRKTFNIVNDCTKEEEEEIRRENAWAFE